MAFNSNMRQKLNNNDVNTSLDGVGDNELLAQQPWHVNSTDIESNQSDIIPLRSLTIRPFYKNEGRTLSIQHSILPKCKNLLQELGQRPVTGGRLQEFPEAYATAIWMVGYFGYQCIVVHPEKDYDPVLNKHLSYTLKVSTESVKLAKMAVRNYLLIYKDKTIKQRQKKFNQRLGSEYKPTELLQDQEFHIVDQITINIPQSSPLTEEELDGLKVHNNRKFTQTAIRPKDASPTILDILKANGAPTYEYEASLQTNLSEELFEELNNYKTSDSRLMSHGKNKSLKSDILFFVEHLQNQFIQKHLDMNMYEGEWIEHGKEQYFEIGYHTMAEMWDINNSDSQVRPCGQINY